MNKQALNQFASMPTTFARIREYGWSVDGIHIVSLVNAAGAQITSHAVDGSREDAKRWLRKNHPTAPLLKN